MWKLLLLKVGELIMALFKPPIGSSVKSAEIAANAEKLDNIDSTGFANNNGTLSSTFQVDSDNNGPVLENISGKLGVKTSTGDYGTIRANTLHMANDSMIRDDSEGGRYGIRVYHGGDDTIGSVYCGDVFAGNMYLGSTISSPTIYDTFIYYPAPGDEDVVDISIPFFKPGINEIQDNDFPTDTTSWETVTSNETDFTNIVSTIEVGHGNYGENARKVSFTYTKTEPYGGSISNSQDFPEPSTDWVQNGVSYWARITTAESLTGLQLQINAEPYGSVESGYIDVSSWSLNEWHKIEITEPIYPYQGIPFEAIRFSLYLGPTATAGSYAFEIVDPRSYSASESGWMPISDITLGNARVPLYHGELASEPATYAAGDSWYDTSSTGELKQYVTSVGWITIGTP